MEQRPSTPQSRVSNLVTDWSERRPDCRSARLYETCGKMGRGRMDCGRTERSAAESAMLFALDSWTTGWPAWGWSSAILTGRHPLRSQAARRFHHRCEGPLLLIRIGTSFLARCCAERGATLSISAGRSRLPPEISTQTKKCSCFLVHFAPARENPLLR
jgi:hypothetical protein